MSGNEEHFFEGAEKLLEIWFEETSCNNDDLRNISRSDWEDVLSQVNCEIISFSKNDLIDAFVLSESSMFVSKRRWILKTCGTTTPLKCLSQLIKLASLNGYKIITDLFYSRKNFIRPEAQVTPHKGFTEEVSYLDTLFPNGRSYCLGSMNLECWYLYTFSRSDMKLSPGHMINEGVESDPDQTIEILMQNLDQNAMSVFNKKNILSASDATSMSGIDKILPNMHIDDFLFDPCGYSMNGINEKGEYMTIHITPENLFSYVSFETNVAMTNYRNLINQVINTFKPGKFIVTIFANKCSLAYETMKELEVEYSKESHWKRTDMQCCNFPSYNLLFAQYSYNGKNNCSI
ncbi:S-adenosylmethionine decarboxylase proenzyme isoform X1 [Drosophila pseudoobscura]|uniref:S-adenosylmethionine decarboxylase proenzyme n=2 Tax=Drosophila pseudoobscura pseudoobscura TaxID=46245 RepID=A0A6I8W073_DROPS|nr:S-adenosylmethionine decarboxylase proenzyme isoform X1 [Drosophila pseudoobscura]